MKPRRLIDAEESTDELALALERIAALEAWKDRAQIIMLRQNERQSLVEDRLDMDVPETVPAGHTVAGFAKRVHRSPETIRKLIRHGRIPFDRIGAHVVIAADAALPPRRGKSTIRPD